MNSTELAERMLEWGKKHQELALLTAEIETAVLELGKTQNVGNVRATYSKGRKRYDYQAGGSNVPEAFIVTNTVTKTVTSTDWKSVCKEAGVTDVPFTQGEPSVKVKAL